MIALSHHAQRRLQQRGIPACVVESLIDYGCCEHDHHGARTVFFDHRTKNRLISCMGVEAYHRIESHLDTYAVITQDGEVVTVGHRTSRINRH